MTERRLAVLLMPLLAMLVAACIPIPYKPDATMSADATAVVPPVLIVSCDEDEQTGALADEIKDLDPAIKALPHREVAAVVFPDGDTTVAALADPARRARLQQDLGVSYVVLIGDLTGQELSHHGGFIPLLGAGTWTEQKAVTAAVLDVASGEALGGVSATTEGRTSGVIYGFYGVFLVPMLDTSVYEAIAQGVVDTIRTRTTEGRVLIVVARAHGLGTDPCDGDPDCTPPELVGPRP
jgi:hypothetical protein